MYNIIKILSSEFQGLIIMNYELCIPTYELCINTK